MFVSILQRFVPRVLRQAAQPLQSRADQNTRKINSGGQPGTKSATKRIETHPGEVFEAGRRQTNQEIWQQVGLNCAAAVWPGSRRGGPWAIPGLLPRGDTL